MTRVLVAALGVVAAFGTLPLPASPAAPRIVAIGDVHGGSDAFVSILKTAGLIGDSRQWTGGTTVLVQTGDMTDRGTGTRETLELVMSLENAARKTGGRVHTLLGNHEVMNMLGHMRDATPEIFATFGGEAAMREAFGPRGRYGQWLRRRPAALLFDGTIFMHAGINPEYTKDSIEDLNRSVRREIEAWDAGVAWLVDRKLLMPNPAFDDAIAAARSEIQRLNALHGEGRIPPDAPETAQRLLPVANIASSLLFHPEGPLWFRGFSTWTDEEGEPLVSKLLDRYGARRFVTGHTVQPGGRIRQRFGGRLFLIDTGLLAGKYYPGGAASALELTPGGTREIYVE